MAGCTLDSAVHGGRYDLADSFVPRGGMSACTVTLDAAKTLTAQFVATLTVHVTLQEPSTYCEGYVCNCNVVGTGCAPYPPGCNGAHTIFDGGTRPDCLDDPNAFAAGTTTCDYVVDAARPEILIDARSDGGANIAVFDHPDGCHATIGPRCGINISSKNITVIATYSS